MLSPGMAPQTASQLLWRERSIALIIQTSGLFEKLTMALGFL